MLIHRAGRVIPGQFAGEMGAHRDPWFIELLPASTPKPTAPSPSMAFTMPRRPQNPKDFVVPGAEPVAARRGWTRRGSTSGWTCSSTIDRSRRRSSERPRTSRSIATARRPSRCWPTAQTQQAFDVADADPKVLDRYGRNTFGWSLLMARQLVEAGVNLVQVNLGNNETWDTHGNAFPHLKDKLSRRPTGPCRRLLDDLAESGLLDTTLIVMAGEFGRTPQDFAPCRSSTPSRAATTGARRPCSSPAAACAAAR